MLLCGISAWLLDTRQKYSQDNINVWGCFYTIFPQTPFIIKSLWFACSSSFAPPTHILLTVRTNWPRLAVKHEVKLFLNSYCYHVAKRLLLVFWLLMSSIWCTRQLGTGFTPFLTQPANFIQDWDSYSIQFLRFGHWLEIEPRPSAWQGRNIPLSYPTVWPKGD